MNNLVDTIQYFLIITAELTVLFLGISTVVALVLMYIPQDKLRQWLSHRGIWGNFLGAVVGSLTPFCACSTIPMTLGMLNAGAPFGPVMSFVIASPLLNPIIISMIFALMGIKACLLYFGVTFLGSILFGVFLEKIGGVHYVKKVRIKSNCCGTARESENLPINFSEKFKASFISAWGDFRAVLIYLLIGVGIGAGIYGYIPQDFLTKIAGPDNPFAIPIAAIIGIPLYIRAETAIPIGLALFQKGMSMGAVIALIIGGAGMAIPEMVMLASIFRKRLVSAIVAVIFATAVVGGYLFNTIL
ncbi:permease [Syntrophobacter fumaroxidans]|mgnify:CR=1 FL=1|uniref:Permease n=1 Tax=Syntrophobacter fumaroxidans (strain DSM 10017 / MPOB) TaxID=335543 RepID=A0LQ26_SYNFM|nr:permease [Syntrophobacter fumaroxidans]ABK19528.1 permease [Syntrophobacter fumaroxidans MPOB]